MGSAMHPQSSADQGQCPVLGTASFTALEPAERLHGGVVSNTLTGHLNAAFEVKPPHPFPRFPRVLETGRFREDRSRITDGYDIIFPGPPRVSELQRTILFGVSAASRIKPLGLSRPGP